MHLDRIDARSCQAELGGDFELYPARETLLGALPIWRALPIRGRRLVGPWCFLDRYGPLSFTDAKPMDVAPHPHIGLQTVTWLLEGEVVHNDSLGSEALLRPRGVNVMTSGAGIAHSEETPHDHSGKLNGVQLWVALPEADRNAAASFQHLGEVPTIEQRGGIVKVFAGKFAGVASPAQHFSGILGADVAVRPGTELDVPVDAAYEHALMLLSGDATVEGSPFSERTLFYMPPGRNGFAIRSATGARLLLIGGLPFPEKILMWWNFVARTPEEIAQARADWEKTDKFGDVRGYPGARLAAPPLVRFAQPNPAS